MIHEQPIFQTHEPITSYIHMIVDDLLKLECQIHWTIIIVGIIHWAQCWEKDACIEKNSQ